MSNSDLDNRTWNLTKFKQETLRMKEEEKKFRISPISLFLLLIALVDVGIFYKVLQYFHLV